MGVSIKAELNLAERTRKKKVAPSLSHQNRVRDKIKSRLLSKNEKWRERKRKESEKKERRRMKGERGETERREKERERESFL